MDLNEYHELAMRTADPERQSVSRLTNAALGLAGESGEVADHLKKHIFHGHELDRDKLRRELGDVLWYVCQAADALGLTLDEVAQHNIAKLRSRYPDGFSFERSINREEG